MADTHRELIERARAAADVLAGGRGGPHAKAVRDLADALEKAYAKRALAPVIRERDELRAHLRWALEEWFGRSGRMAEDDPTPSHACDLTNNPLKGACDFHERFWTAWEAAEAPLP